jgi:DNA-binding CsgD family transcriptional regulator
MEDHYLQRIRELPVSTQQLMLVAAADPTADPTLVWSAAHTLGVQADAAAAADDADLLQIGSRVRFRHPLVRSAAYAAATPAERSAAHAALAAVTDPERDPERHVWYLAAAATDADEAVAMQLEETAGRVLARAGLAAAAAFLDRSAALTSDPARRVDRSLAAAYAHIHAGEFDAARRLVAEAAAMAVDDLQRARIEQRSGQIESAAQPGPGAPARLLHAASRLEALDVRLARDTYLQAWWAAVLAGQFATPDADLVAVSRAAIAAPRTLDPRPTDLLLEGLATTVIHGRPAAAPILREAVDLYLTDQVTENDWVLAGRGATSAAYILWDVNSWRELSERQVARARTSGALASLALALNLHAFGATCCGDLETATLLVAEQNAVKEVTGVRIESYGAPMLAAYQGRTADRSLQRTTTADELTRGEDGYALEFARLGSAVLHNALGRYAEAFAAAHEIAYTVSFLAPQALSELIEAAVRSGSMDVARDALHQLSAFIVSGSDWAAGIEARSRALVSEGDAAEQSYVEAIACLARTPLRPDLARAQLLYGEWLRREHRRVDAREQLRAAHDAFSEMGAEPFAERARRELVATGERVRKRSADTVNDLTPQEEHIARLARDGRTNAEIAAELFLSTRTVEWHLRKVFMKLGISSRRELSDAFVTAKR